MTTSISSEATILRIKRIIDLMNLQKKKSEFYLKYQLRNEYFTILPFVA